ncbi:protein peanut isoform X2 [Condylostylus longicornis]|uniref:protein peanut isoform X2 n=1 Tax=Condylostylus longicornis TaxID=2530218 RepID=UPI00244E108E|nr:protein peanut isoform X2 [Condylostylus longicornis]
MSASQAVTINSGSCNPTVGSGNIGVGGVINDKENGTMTTTTNTSNGKTGPPNGPPPIPPTKPILSSPGSYKQNFVNTNNTNLFGTIGSINNTTPLVTAGIHSVNKSSHSGGGSGDKPAIAARPIPPPTLPKYSSSFGKIDRDRNEFKIDRADREKDKIGGSYRLASLDRLASRQRLLEQNGGLGNTAITFNNENNDNAINQQHNNNIPSNTRNLIINDNNGIDSSTNSSKSSLTSSLINNSEHHNTLSGLNNTTKNTSIRTTTASNGVLNSVKFTTVRSSTTTTLQNKREMFFKSDSHGSPSGPPPNPPIPNSHVNSNSTSQNSTPTNEKHQNIQGSQIMNNSTIAPVLNGTTTHNSNITNGINGTTPNVSAITNNLNNLSFKEKQQQLLINNDGHSDSNKIANDRYVDKEKQIVRPKPKELDGYVGFANLPNQVYRKAVKKGFEFTLMVVGESGLGKSTLINSMFLSDIYNQDQYPGPSLRIKKTVAVESTKVLLKENGVNLSLTVVDTPGFGDAVDNSNCWVPIIDFIESKYEEYLTAESRVHRKATPDNRVHLCLYFIAPSGHGLKPLDVEFMQRLCDKVNIIPVIAKADTMTPEEVQLFKKQILNEIAQHKIKIYDFPEPLEDEEEAKVLKTLKNRVPFAIVGANTVIEVDGKKIRGRRYPWGIAEVENLEHCDFIALRNMVIRTHLQDLKDVTNSVHYENYRCRKLAGLGNDGKTRMSNKNPLAQMEEEKREHDLKMKKMEAEMEQVFEMKVKEKKQKLKDSELELTRRHEERKKALDSQLRELEERRRAFEQEKKEWEESNNITLDELRRRSLEANSKETASMSSRNSDESKGRRVFGSLLRRHTSFGAPDGQRGPPTTTPSNLGPNNSNSLPPAH